MNDSSKINYWKLAFALVLAWYYILYAYGDPTHTYANWNLIDSADLIIHEAGHVIFSPFGEFIYILGGSLTQVALPTIFAGYFFFRREYFSGSVVLFWIAENILYVATYMGDSIRMQLPLLGGNESIHDWNYLLSHMGLLQYTDILSTMTRDIGTSLIFLASLLCIWFSLGEMMRKKMLQFFKN